MNATVKPRTLTVTLPDGTTATRKTKANYSHVVVCFGLAWNQAEPTWHAFSWHSTEAAAAKNIKQAAIAYSDVRVVAIEN